jgi:ABC-type multidrug transport system fused ATPase/permease subunit
MLVMVRVKMLLLGTSTARHSIESVASEVHLDVLLGETSSNVPSHHWNLGHHSLDFLENILEIWETRLRGTMHELGLTSVSTLRHPRKGISGSEINRETWGLLLLTTIITLGLRPVLLILLMGMVMMVLLLLHVGPSMSPRWLSMSFLLHLLSSLMSASLSSLRLLLLLLCRGLCGWNATKLSS